jgi:putative NADH-flavin reductase
MKLIVFGASSVLGHQLVATALQQGHLVTAFGRSPDKLAMTDSRLNFFRGDVLDPGSVQQAMQGMQSVICSLGAGRKGVVRSSGTRNIVSAMQQASVRRLICQTTLGVGDSRQNLDFFWKYVMFGLLLKAAFADHVEQERWVRESNLDWTIVRPGAFTDGARTGEYSHGFAANDRSTQLKISRADLADFLLRQLVDDTYLHQAVGISY